MLTPCCPAGSQPENKFPYSPGSVAWWGPYMTFGPYIPTSHLLCPTLSSDLWPLIHLEGCSDWLLGPPTWDHALGMYSWGAWFSYPRRLPLYRRPPGLFIRSSLWCPALHTLPFICPGTGKLLSATIIRQSITDMNHMYQGRRKLSLEAWFCLNYLDISKERFLFYLHLNNLLNVALGVCME